MTTITERVAGLGITRTARELPERRTPVWSHPHRRFRMILRREIDGETRKLSVEWRQGMAHAEPSNAAEILDVLAGDAAGYLNARNWHEWATEYGYDTDEPKDRSRAERLYFTIGEQTEKLQTFLGDDFDALVWQTERL